MNTLLKYGWHFLLAAIAGELILPFVLALFYRGYRHSTMVISSLGSVNSPVRLPFNLWMLSAGLLFLAAAPVLYRFYRDLSGPLSVALVSFLAVFAVGACIFPCFFSVNESKEVVTTASRLHGAGSAVGFLAMLFVPLLIALLSRRGADRSTLALSLISFPLGLLFFVLFIMGDKPGFQGTAVAMEGLWQRLNLLFLYLPLAWVALRNLL